MNCLKQEPRKFPKRGHKLNVKINLEPLHRLWRKLQSYLPVHRPWYSLCISDMERKAALHDRRPRSHSRGYKGRKIYRYPEATYRRVSRQWRRQYTGLPWRLVGQYRPELRSGVFKSGDWTGLLLQDIRDNLDTNDPNDFEVFGDIRKTIADHIIAVQPWRQPPTGRPKPQPSRILFL